ncbi:MAG: SoxR reducing system RseC family protein [Deltaproteobacteria bacterium]|nr:SoxR reducing system RseC family protein [Deltaproteobacteria bacterium]
MVTERGIIEDVTGQKTLVRISKSSACATCESRGSCEVSSGRSMLVEVANDLGGGKGDHVELSVPSGALLKLSLLFLFMGITFYLLKRLDRSSRDRGKFQPRMTRIFPRSDHRQPDSDRSSPE